MYILQFYSKVLTVKRTDKYEVCAYLVGNEDYFLVTTAVSGRIPSTRICLELLEAFFFLEICVDMENIVSCSIIILLQDAEVRLSYFDFCSRSVCLVSSAPLDSFPPVLVERFTRALPLICDPRLHRCTFPIHRLNPPKSLSTHLSPPLSPSSALSSQCCVVGPATFKHPSPRIDL